MARIEEAALHDRLEWDTPLFRTALAQYEQSLPYAAVSEGVAERLPDILTNAGGVTVSYFEWVQDRSRLFWDRAEIRRKLAEKLNDAFDRVWDVSVQRDVTLRTAALVTGIREVAAALDARGLYP